MEVFDVKTGQTLWSPELGLRHGTGLRDVGRGGALGISMWNATQVRDLSTGALLFEAAGLSAHVLATLPDKGISLLADGVAIEVRDLQSGELLHRLDDFDGIHDIRISTDGDRLLAAINGDDRTGVAIWRTADWSLERFIEMDSQLRSIHPLSDADLIAVYDLADTFRVWRISTEKEVRRFSHTKTATEVVTASDADRAVTRHGGSLRVWSTRDGTELAHRLSHGRVTRLAVSPDGRTVAYVTARQRASRRGGDPYEGLVIWEPDMEVEPVILPVASPRELRFDPHGKFLAVRLGDETARVFEVATLRTISTLKARPGSKMTELGFSSDGALLYVREQEDRKYESGLRVFRVGSGAEVARIEQSSTFLPLPEPHRVATRDYKGNWRSWEIPSAVPDELLWATESRELNYRHRTRRFVTRSTAPPRDELPKILSNAVMLAPQVGGSPFHTWAIDTHGRRLAGMQDSDALVVALDDGRLLARWPKPELKGAGVGVGPHFRSVRGMAFADRGDTLIAYDNDGYQTADVRSRLWLWRWQSQSPRLLSTQNPINTVAVSPAGDLFASAEGNHFQDRRSRAWARVGTAQVRIWNARTGEELGRIPAEAIVYAVAFNATGDRLAVRTSDGVVVFQLSDRQEVARFEFTSRPTIEGSVAFTPDGKAVLAEAGGGVQMWSLDGAADRLFRHGSEWPRYQLSEDGRLLVTLSKNSLRVWDLDTGAGLFELEFPYLKYKNVLFLGSNNDLIAETDAGLVRIPWRADHLVAEGCGRLVRDIDDDEWRKYFDEAAPAEICAGLAPGGTPGSERP